MSRAAQVRALVRVLGETAGTRLEAHYDPSTCRWEVEWSNGVTVDTMRAAAGKLAARHRLDPGVLTLRRIVQDDGFAVQAVRVLTDPAAAGLEEYQTRERHAVHSAVQHACETTDHPDRPTGEREAVMAARLRAACEGGEYAIAALLADRGLSWLIAEDLPTARPGDRQWAAEYLTDRYATGDQAAAWRHHLRTLPPRQAVAAATGDPDAGPVARLAALTLTPLVRHELEAALAELDAAELDLIRQARDDGTGWPGIGAALGMTKQGAEQRAARLARRTGSTPR